MTSPLDGLLDLARRARGAASLDELGFLAVNDSYALTPYRQAALWFADGGVRTLSGVVQVEANAPYVHWLEQTCQQLSAGNARPGSVSAGDLDGACSGEWAEWLPAHGLWLPLRQAGGGCLLARDTPWQIEEEQLLAEWFDVWQHAWCALRHSAAGSWWPGWRWQAWRDRMVAWLLPEQDKVWWRQRRARSALATIAVLIFPVRLTVLAPGELVPANPVVIRAPLDGVVGAFFVRPNEAVKLDQPLLSFDDAVLASRYEVAAQSRATAEAEYRQAAQQALTEAKSKAQLAVLAGKIEERRAEADYLRAQRDRSQMLAPIEGIALFDDPVEWIGRPVLTGERIMRVAVSGDVEIEAWLGVGDAIPLGEGATVNLYLSAAPLSSLSARVRYVAHEAVQRPDGSYAYRVRARLDDATDHRVGLKGTAKLHGQWVPLVYWVIRRPWATIRQFLGW